LVASANLQTAITVLEKMIEIMALKNHIAELGVGNPHLFSVDATFDRVFLKHPVDRIIFAYIA
jgi:hypothetical protein